MPIQLIAIDDDPSNLELIVSALENQDVKVITHTDPERGLKDVLLRRPELALVDLVMPMLGGFEVLERIVAVDPGIEVMIMTANYSTESAVEAIQKGASDYLPKPLDLARFRERMGKYIEDAQKRKASYELDKQVLDAHQFEGIVGKSPLMLEMFVRIRRVAPHFRTALITGPTGSGKELVANALHRLSPTPSAPLAVCNCSAIVETLFESELFGYVRGAFTGANQDKVGLFEFANGGTVFLDEIGEMPLSAQAKLLRVLQNQEVQRVGSPAIRKVNVRVVAATHRDLRVLVAEGKFREDLFYRLSMIEISVPRLADRKEDLSLLENHFVQKYAAQYHKQISGITRRAQAVLSRHSWPGNVRELENVLGNACMMVDGAVIDVNDVPVRVRTEAREQGVGSSGIMTLEEVQNRHVLLALKEVNGNKAKAAETLGISRTTLYAIIDKIEGVEEGSSYSSQPRSKPA
jgi:DNA-binding NtrC family response regulator